jgi:chromosome segregation ATPase
MARQSTDQEALTLTLPAELEEWLDERAGKLEVDRETVLVQLLASYRAAAELGEDSERPPVADTELIADTVDRMLDSRLEDELDAIRTQFEERADTIEADYTDKVEDVRDRVIQVKKETDRKAPLDHGHPEIEQIDGLIDRVDTLADSVGPVAGRLDDLEERAEKLDSAMADHDEAIDDFEDRFETIQDRLQSVAWVVNDLREGYGDNREAVDRIKSAAATDDIDRAKCERCDNGVTIALLTDPECPHCQATVTDVEPATGFFSKPTLLTASQLESGEGR